MHETEIDLGALGFDRGAHILVRLALARAGRVWVRGGHPDLARNLRTWCRLQGLEAPQSTASGLVVESAHATSRLPGVDGSPLSDGPPPADLERTGGRWRGAVQAGSVGPDGVLDHAAADWSFAPRGAWIEAGGEPLVFPLDRKDAVWSDTAARAYAQAAAAQWDPREAIDWTAPIAHGAVVEQAVVQVMAYMVENEEAALVVPARFLGQIHPHFREIQQVLAIQVADEARHIDVFTRRANLRGPMHVLSTVGGRRSLQTLLEEPDFAVGSFLLSVLGEGTFLSLLGFLERDAPDDTTRRIAQLARIDEARHVAFAMAHLERHLGLHPTVRSRLAAAVERRHTALADTAGLNEEVFDALVILASSDGDGRLSHAAIRADPACGVGPAPSPQAIGNGWDRVGQLQADMHDQRRARLLRLGFDEVDAGRLSSLHTRNFM